MNRNVVDRINHFIKQRDNKLKGKYNGLPIYKILKRFGEYLPAFPQGSQILFTSGSGTGKSHFWLGVLLYPLYKLIKTEGLKVIFIINLLEDPEEMFIDRLFCRVLYEEYNIQIDPLELSSYKDKALDEDILNKINNVASIIEDILSYCHIQDNIVNPTGIYKYCRDISNKLGTHHTKQITIDGKEKTVYSHYEPNDPEQSVLVITDNLNNLSEEGGLNLHQCIDMFCKEYCRKQMVKHWKFIVFNIIQQAAASEAQQYTLRGDAIISKVKPSLVNLGDNKLIQRVHHIILGLFSPDRFEIEEYLGYDITKLRDNIKFLSILKTNIGQGNKEIALFFNGICSVYKELKKELNNQDYEAIDKLVKKPDIK